MAFYLNVQLLKVAHLQKQDLKPLAIYSGCLKNEDFESSNSPQKVWKHPLVIKATTSCEGIGESSI